MNLIETVIILAAFMYYTVLFREELFPIAFIFAMVLLAVFLKSDSLFNDRA